MTNTKDIDELIEQKKEKQEAILSDAEIVLDFFLNNIGQLYTRDEVSTRIVSETSIERETQALNAIRSVVGDIVDPVQQITTLSENDEVEKCVGVIEYNEYPEYGAYGYIHFDDTTVSKKKRIVCQQCVNQYDTDENVSNATEGQGSIPEEVSWDYLLEVVEEHYDNEHDATEASKVQPGASLLTGTTIAGNTAFHAGNDGSGSGLDADTVDGTEAKNLGAALGWSEDENSPVSVNSQSSLSVSVTGGFDRYLLRLDMIGSGNSGDWELQLNNYTQTDYHTMDNADDRISNASAWKLIDDAIAGRRIAGNMTLFVGGSYVGATADITSPYAEFVEPNTMAGGSVYNLNTDVTNIDISHTGSSTVSGELEVYHRDVL